MLWPFRVIEARQQKRGRHKDLETKYEALKEVIMESIGCAKAGGKSELERISEFFSDQCSQLECPQFNLCKNICVSNDKGADDE